MKKFIAIIFLFLSLAGTSQTLIDTYALSNIDSYYIMGSYWGTTYSQSFTSTASSLNISTVTFSCKKVLLPTGNCNAVLYSHAGTYGSSSIRGTLLATSDNYDVSLLSTTTANITFTFSAANRVALNPSTYYCIGLTYTGGNSTNYISLGYDGSSPTASGNVSSTTNGSSSGRDIPFVLYGIVLSSTSIKAINTVGQANISKVNSVTNATINKIATISNK